MKRYFYSGNTNIKNGRNVQTFGVIEVEDDDASPGEIANQLAKEKAEEFEADTFCVVTFNRID